MPARAPFTWLARLLKLGNEAERPLERFVGGLLPVMPKKGAKPVGVSVNNVGSLVAYTDSNRSSRLQKI